jgi:hypothetical protein
MDIIDCSPSLKLVVEAHYRSLQRQDRDSTPSPRYPRGDRSSGEGISILAKASDLTAAGVRFRGSTSCEGWQNTLQDQC